MKTKNIYRIEHPEDGKGIFKSQTLSIFSSVRITNASCYEALVDKHLSFPNPCNDNLDIFYGIDFCAFKSLRQMKKWIEQEWWQEIIGKLGFRVYRIKVSCYKEGKYQILYRKQNILNKDDITTKFL